MSRANGASLAVLMLILCCLFWGISFPVMQLGCDAMEKAVAGKMEDGRWKMEDGSILHPPSSILSFPLRLAIRATFNGWRFALAALAYYLLTHRRQRHFTPQDRLGGLTVGLFFALGMFPQIVGLRYIRASVSGFLTSLAVIFAPLAQGILFRRPVGLRTWLAVAIAVLGITLLSREDPSSAGQGILATPPLPHFGEIITIFASVLFTGQILSVDHFGQKSDPVRLTLVMFLTTAVLSISIGLALSGTQLYHPQILRAALFRWDFWRAMVVLVLLSSLVTNHLMNRFQPLVSPATASVIYCLEPVFATAFSLALGTERLALPILAGGAAVLLAVAIVAARPTPRIP
jgi:drug/metabolite transporter (DMT)-like permease